MTAIAVALAAVSSAMFASAMMRRTGRPRRLTDSPDHSVRRVIRVPSLHRKTSPGITPTALASWCDDLARALRHGSTVRSALVDISPTDAIIDRHTQPLRHWLDRGASVAEACDEWSDELANSALHRKVHRIDLVTTFAAVLAATAALGGNSAAPLDRFAATMRQRASGDLERAAQSAQAQMSAKVLTLVPIGVLVLLLATDAEVRNAVTSPAGATAVTVGLVLNMAGAVWMRRIVTPTGASA